MAGHVALAACKDADKKRQICPALDTAMCETVNAVSAGAPQEHRHKHGAPEHSADRAGWYILRCGAGTEFRAEETLRDSGWDVFLPRERKWRTTLLRRRPIEAEYPRFPRYLFVEVAPPQWPDWRSWPLAALIRGVLGMGGCPVPLAPGEVERLMAEDGRTVIPAASVPLHRAFAAGQTVRVRAGAWRDWTVRLDAIDDDGAHFEVPLLGRRVRASAPLQWLEAA